MNAPAPLTVTDVHNTDIPEMAAALGVSRQAVQKRAAKWTYTEKKVRGGSKRLYPLTTLPRDVRDAVQQHRMCATLSGAVSSPAAPLPVATATATGLSIPCADLTDEQRNQRDARAGVLAAIRKLQIEAGCSQNSAMTTLLTAARAGSVSPVLATLLRQAADTRGKKGDGFPSIRTLKRWLAAKDLTPRVKLADMTPPPWAKDFLAFWQQPQNMSLAHAYEEWAKNKAADQVPSYHQVYRFTRKLGAVTRERGRRGPRELKNIRPFVRRDFSDLGPNDVWTADGHTFDAEVQHPRHGRPFRPEITSIIDVATRRCVGWSVDLAESGMAVVDALRYAVERNGIPAIFYVDNGSGYNNALLKGEATGLLGRMGTTITHSLPYNSQAKGVIERSHRTIWVRSAQLLPSYVGHRMDREARLAQFKVTRQALKGGGSMPLIPFDVFVAFAEQRVAEYNARAHSSLGGVSPDLCWQSFVDQKGWEIHQLEGDVNTLFRPREIRTVRRGELELHTNIYFSRQLEEFHGDQVQVGYDIHDPRRVWVYTPEGRFICTAEANGNRTAYMPVAFVDQAREKRGRQRLKRNAAKRTEILEEMHGTTLNALNSNQIVLGGQVIDAKEISPISTQLETVAPQATAQPMDEIEIEQTSFAQEVAQMLTESKPKDRTQLLPEENYADWLEIDARIRAGEQVGEEDAYWHESYQRTAQFRVMAGNGKAAA